MNTDRVIADLRKQIASLRQTENLLRQTVTNLEYLYDKAQEEIGQLRKPDEGLTLEEIKNKYFPKLSWEELGRKSKKSIFDKET